MSSQKSTRSATASRRLPAAERRKQILDAALPLFAVGGLAATGTREIAAACGVSEPILYRHFEDKEALFLAALYEAGERVLCELDASMKGKRTSHTRMRALAGELPDLLDRRRAELSIMLAASRATDGNRSMQAEVAGVIRRLGQRLTDAFADAPLRHGLSPTTVGFLMLQVGMGAAVLRPLDLEEIEHDAYSSHVLDTLLRGSLKRRN